MYVSPETLDLHLTELQRHFELVHLDEWLRLAKGGAFLPKLACAITFDDGWRDNYEFALPVLAKHAVPATVFLVSGFIGTAYRFWPNQLMKLLQKSVAEPGAVDFPPRLRSVVEPVLAAARGRNEVEAAIADRAVQEAKAFDEAEIRSLIDAAEKSCGGLGETGDLMDREEVLQMAATGLVRYGSHTATHFRLGGRISSEELEREIVASRKQLQELSGQAIELFCYPNGETSSAAIDLVRRHYLGAVTTSRGWCDASGDPHLIRRIGMHEDVSHTRDALLSRISGWI